LGGSKTYKRFGLKQIRERLIRGYLSFLENNLDTAERVYSELHEKFPDSQLIAYNLLLVLIKKGDFEKAKKILDDFIERKRVIGGKIKEKLSRNIIMLKFVLDLFTEDIYKTIIWLKEHLYEELFICHPDWEGFPGIEFNLVKFFEIADEETAKLQKFLAEERKSDYIFPINRQIRETIYFLLKEKGSKDATKSLYLKGIFGIVALSLNKIDEAKSIINELSDSEDVDVILLRGKIKFCIGDLNGALKDFTKALRYLKNDQRRFIPLVNLSVIYLLVGDYEKAIQLVGDALRARADCFMCWYVRALILLKSEEWNEAERAFKALLEWKKDDPSIWFGLGRAYLAKNKILESIEALLKAKKLDPSNEEYQIYLELARKITRERRGKT